MTFKKLKWVFGFVMIFLLILATNLIDDRNFKKIKDSTLSIYEERLLTKNVVFNLLMLIQEKEVALAKQDTIFYRLKNTEVDRQLEEMISTYEDSRPTPKELETIRLLSRSIEDLQGLERKYVQSLGTPEAPINAMAIEGQFAVILSQLDALAEIQLTEGRRQIVVANQAVDSVELFMQIEVVALIIIAVFIMVLILYTPKTKLDDPDE